MAALSCPPGPPAAGAAAHAHGDHDHAPAPHAHADEDHPDAHESAATTHGDHVHTGCNDHVVLAAAGGLSAVGAAMVSPLLAVVREGDDANRTFAGYALSRMPPAAAPVLLAALGDPEPRIRLAIVAAICGWRIIGHV